MGRAPSEGPIKPCTFESHRLLDLRRTPHPVIVTIRDNKDYIGVLLYSSSTTITGWGGPPKLVYAPRQPWNGIRTGIPGTYMQRPLVL